MGFISGVVDAAKNLSKKVVEKGVNFGKEKLGDLVGSHGAGLLGAVAPEENPCIPKRGEGPLITRDSLSNGGAMHVPWQGAVGEQRRMARCCVCIGLI